jgi:hypothetical protein
MSKQKTWSKRAKCYDAKHTENGTVLYYECLITGKKTEIRHSEKLTLSSYIGYVVVLV